MTIIGGPLLRKVLVAGFVLAFLALHFYIAKEVVHSKTGVIPDIDDLTLALAAGTSGVVGAGFAAAMGVEKKDPKGVTLGVTAFPPLSARSRSWDRVILSAGVWGYALVGVVLGAVYFLNRDESPEVVAAMVTGFAGYVLALATSFFGAIKDTP